MYRVFTWYQYYPCGGINDLKEEFATIKGCWEYLAWADYEHYQIVDKDFVVIAEG